MTTSKKLGFGCAAVVLLCCGGGALVMQGLFGSAASRRDTELAEARKAGIPVEPAELEALVRVPDAQNAAPIYRQAEKLIEGNKAYEADIKTIGTGLSKRATPADRQAMAEALSRLAPVQKLVEKGSDLPGCDFHYDWSQGAKLMFPEFAHMKGWVRLLCADAELRSERGDWRGALVSIRRGQRIAQHSGSTPILIGMLVGVASESISFASFNRIINAHHTNPAFIAAAKQTMERMGGLPDFRRSMMGELVLGRQSIRSLQGASDLRMDGETHAEPSRWEKAFFQSSQVQGAFDAKLVEAYRKLIQELPKDPTQWEKSAEVSKARGRAIEADRSLANALNRIVMPVFEQAAESVGQTIMRRRLAQTTLNLLDEKVKKGAYPRVLPNYGASRIDPFSDHPLHYLRQGGGFLLYSVGRDRVDDNAAPRDPKDSTKTFDEAIRIK